MKEFINADCMEVMKNYPDKFFDLAIVDPPYGAGFTETGGCQGWFSKYHQDKGDGKIISWDESPSREYFDELFRISCNQIIWGGNYFELPPTKCFLVWRKVSISEEFTMAMCEYAWTSFNSNAKVFEFRPQGKKGERIHPTQKPVELYEWILRHYAKEGDKILDTHVGSASSLIACERLGFDYVGCEIDAEYYKKAKERLEMETAQKTIWNYEE